MILSVVDFVENYIFTTKKETHSVYYHSNQVSIRVHVLYIHAQHSIDNIENTNVNRYAIKEYHFYIIDDRTHDTHYVSHSRDSIVSTSDSRMSLVRR